MAKLRFAESNTIVGSTAGGTNNLVLVLVVSCAIILSLLPPPISCRPPREDDTMAFPIQNCKSNITVEENCQKCAKMTKSPLVFPMCCADAEGVYSWCEEYVNYGIH